jgi:putative ABC transport system ATP-binding protein
VFALTPRIASADSRHRLDVADLTATRQGREALSGLTFLLRAGEIISVAGPSGCGKTTLLRVLGRLEPALGRILLDGIDARQIPVRTYRRRVSVVLQESPMFEGSVADNVAFGPRLQARPLDPDRVHALLEQVGLTSSFAARDASELSGGERQRVALARAVANEPDVLLLDEPTSALDPRAATEVLDAIRTLAAHGLGVIAVLHTREHAVHLGGTHYQMSGGRLEREDL